MTDVELLIEWLADFQAGVKDVVASLSPAALAWQPDAQGNSIGVTVWHCARWLDLLAVRALQDQPPEREAWHTQGWAARTGYDPRGHGANGSGTLTGYTWDEVLEIPLLPAPDLLAYLDQATTALADQLRALPPGGLHQLAPGFSNRRTPYQWVKPILQGCFGHIGEIEALAALQSRAGSNPQA
jgi:hypothetical protein